MRLFGIGVEQGVPVVLGDPDVREHGLLAPGLQETYGVQARPVGDVLASGIGGDGHLEGVAARHVRPGRTAVHAFDGTQHDSVDQNDEVRLQMVARSGDLELDAVGLMGVLGGDDVRDIDGRKMVLLTLDAVIDRERGGSAVLSEVNSGGDIVVLILDAVGEDGAAAALGDAHVIEDIEEGAVLRHADRLRTYPFGAAPALVHQSGLEPGGLRLDSAAVLVGDDDLPEIAGHAVERRPSVGDINGFGRAHETRIVDIIAGGKVLLALSHEHAIRRLRRADAVGTHLPAEIRPRLVNSERRLHRFSPEIGDCSRRRSGMAGAEQRGRQQD